MRPRASVMVATVALAALLAGALLAGIDRESASRARLLPDQVMTVLAAPKPLADFALTDDAHRAFNLESLKGKWSFVFFGFTHCPDICPTTLAVLARAREHIAGTTDGAADAQFVFVSVDPNRDRPSGLRRYVRAFDPSFVGVTGDDAQIAKLAAQLGAVYRVESAPGVENYPVTHSAAVYLIDPRARHHAVFTPPLDAEVIGQRFKVVRELAAGAA